MLANYNEVEITITNVNLPTMYLHSIHMLSYFTKLAFISLLAPTRQLASKQTKIPMRTT